MRDFFQMPEPEPMDFWVCPFCRGRIRISLVRPETGSWRHYRVWQHKNHWVFCPSSLCEVLFLFSLEGRVEEVR